MLSNFQLGNHPLLQTLLLGQPEFRADAAGACRARAAAPAGDRRAPPRSRWSRGEIEPYVIHRLQHVGWHGNPLFDPDVFTGLHAASGGFRGGSTRSPTGCCCSARSSSAPRIDAAMLEAVLDEMAGERARARGRAEVAVVEPAGAGGGSAQCRSRGAAAAAASGIDRQVLEGMLAERDAQIAELQQAVVELAHQQDAALSAAVQPEIAALHEQIARLEARLFEQERTVRHTLTMLVEWIEGETEQTRAA